MLEKLPVEFSPAHEDLVHGMAFDFHGLRLATCASDHRVKVWDNNPQDPSQWTLSDAWKAHDASVLKVRWANPEFGSVLATCSFDRSVRIWEEQQADTDRSQVTGKRWAEKARLVDSRGTVQDIAFAPHHAGLKLAVISVDGVLRFYEAMDAMNLAHWTLMEDVDVVASNGSAARERGVEFCLDWCHSRFQPAQLVVGCGKENCAKVFKFNDIARTWTVIETLTGHTDTVHGVAWAPSIGKSFQMIATACKDKHVRIFKLHPVEQDSDSASSSVYRVEMVAAFSDHNAEVWRVEWNIVGNILSSVGDDGRVLLWKENYLGEWSLMSTLPQDISVVDTTANR